MSVVERKEYIDAELCLMKRPPIAGIEGAQNLWDELQFAHITQSNIIHNVVSSGPVYGKGNERFTTLADKLRGLFYLGIDIICVFMNICCKLSAVTEVVSLTGNKFVTLITLLDL